MAIVCPRPGKYWLHRKQYSLLISSGIRHWKMILGNFTPSSLEYAGREKRPVIVYFFEEVGS